MPRDRYEDSDEEDRRRRRRKEESRKRDRKKDSKQRRDKGDRKHTRDSDSESDYRKHRRSHKRRKRRRSDDDVSSENSDYKRRYHDDDDKRRKKKSSKRDDKKKKKTKKSTTKPDKSKLFFIGAPRNSPPETKIDAKQDYFSFHNEFWVYLFREEGVCFNDLDTAQAREAFGRFAEDYNAGRLEEPYYTRSFPSEVLQESKTTKHSWGFKTTTAELKGLGDLQKGIRRQTEYSENKTKTTSSHDVRKMASLPSNEVSCAPVESLQRKRPTVQERRTEQRRDTKRWRETVKLTHEELTGGSKDFRERQLEKKREFSSKIHGAHRDKEAAGVELSDADMYGDGGIQAAKARLSKSKERRNQKQNNRLQELQQKEEDRKNNMLKMLGLENLKGQKLEIAPRK